VRRLLVLAAAAAALAGCGPGADDSGGAPEDVQVLITRDFGAEEVRRLDGADAAAGDTVMRLLQRHFEVETRYGGGFVQALEGLAGGRARDGGPVDWFFYVNGIESEEGAAAREVTEGDRIWWDRRDWGAAQRVPAVVGSFPEPFLQGQDGRRIPLAVVCEGEERSCEEVGERLAAAGVEGVAQSAVGANTGPEVLRVLVGPWSAVRSDPAAQQLEEGPSASGVFVRPGEDGFALLGEDGEVVRTEAEGVGLVAATRFGEQEPTWVVTGTDDVGVAAAAAALREEVLERRFAVALVEGEPVPLPAVEGP
jgi:hypothetical protein